MKDESQNDENGQELDESQNDENGQELLEEAIAAKTAPIAKAYRRHMAIRKMKALKQIEQLESPDSMSTFQDAWLIILSTSVDIFTAVDMFSERFIIDQGIYANDFEAIQGTCNNLQNTTRKDLRCNDTWVKVLLLAYIFCQEYELNYLKEKDMCCIFKAALNCYTAFHNEIDDYFEKKKNQNYDPINTSAEQKMAEYLQDAGKEKLQKLFSDLTEMFLGDEDIIKILSLNDLHQGRLNRDDLHLNEINVIHQQQATQEQEQERAKIAKYQSKLQKQINRINKCLKLHAKDQPENPKNECKRQLKERKLSILSQQMQAKELQQAKKNLHRLERQQQYHRMYNIGRNDMYTNFGVKNALEQNEEQLEKSKKERRLKRQKIIDKGIKRRAQKQREKELEQALMEEKAKEQPKKQSNFNLQEFLQKQKDFEEKRKEKIAAYKFLQDDSVNQACPFKPNMDKKQDNRKRRFYSIKERQQLQSQGQQSGIIKEQMLEHQLQYARKHLKKLTSNKKDKPINIKKTINKINMKPIKKNVSSSLVKKKELKGK